MSEFGHKKSMKKVKFGKRIQIFAIKFKVRLIIKFFKNVNIEKEEVDIEMVTEFKEWSIKRGYIFKVTEKEYPIYIFGHANYKIDGTRHCTILHFSR